MMNNFYNYDGIIHCHSCYSDGYGTPGKILEAAEKTGCNFVILTDHNTLAAKQNGWDGWYNNTLILVGEEITTNTGSHYLGLNIKEELPAGLTAGEVVQKVKDQGGLGFLAHPFGTGAGARLRITDHPWDDWAVNNFTGMEIWNYSQDWSSAIRSSRDLLRIIKGILRPELYIGGPPRKALRRWDQMCAGNRRVVGIGCADAHGIVYSYRRMFRALRTHIITRQPFIGKAKHDSCLVYQALGRGNCYFSYELDRSARHFLFTAETEKTTALMGETIALENKLKLKIRLPQPCLLYLVQNGRYTLLTRSKTRVSVPVNSPGAYRVEGHYPKKNRTIPWIFSNHIYVTN